MIIRKHQHAISKVICLAFGLAISSVLIAEIYFEQTFDTHFKGADRTYYVMENVKTTDKNNPTEYAQTPGAWAPGLKKYAPMVEAATRRLNIYGSSAQMRLDDQRVILSSLSLTDSCFFDVFPQKILVGNAKEVLSRKNYVMVSSEVAKAIGGNVVGRHFTIDDMPGVTFTIGGVFEAFPWSSSFHGEGMLCSLNSIKEFDSYDGRNNWIGNDSYRSFVRLAKGHKPEEVQPYAKRMLEDNIDRQELEKAGVEFKVELQSLNEYYTSDSYVKTMKLVLSIVAFVLLFTSVMNYLLIVIGNLVGRSKEMAVRKCYGAERHNIYSLIFKEAAIDVLLAVVIAAVLIFLCKGTIENFLSASVSALIFNSGAWILVAIILLVLFVGGIVPGWLYNRTPVTVAFRGFVENRHRWKLGLLAAEFAVVGLMLSLLWVINSQYNKLMNLNPGYDYNNVAIVTVQGIDAEQRKQCLTELGRMPEVKMTSSAAYLPLDDWYGAGDNVYLPGDSKGLFNAEDFYDVSDNFFELMGFSLTPTPLQGRGGDYSQDSIKGESPYIFVDETFADKLNTTAHWKGSVVGRRIDVSGHNGGGIDSSNVTFTIAGVFHNIQLGSANTSRTLDRPLMIFYSKVIQTAMLLKLSDLTPEVMQKIRNKVERMFPSKEVEVLSYATEYGNQYISQRNFRNGILISGIVVLIIAFFGLVGYTADEVNRRSKEIAIRKVNGATVKDILGLFLKDIIKIAIPSIIVGGIGAWLISAQWLQNFSVRITLTPVPFVVVTIIILAIISISIVINCYKIANSNPVKYLKDE